MNPAEIIFRKLLSVQYPAVRHLDIGSRGPQQLAVKMSPVEPENILCCEIDEKTIASCRKPCFYGNALDLIKWIAPRSFDLVTALDLIEHFEKLDGMSLLNAVEQLCYGRIIWATPYGDWAVYHGEKYHCHLSGWLPGEFIALGYKVLLFPKAIDTGWFYAIKDCREPVVKQQLPKLPAPYDEWEWIG